MLLNQVILWSDHVNNEVKHEASVANLMIIVQNFVVPDLGARVIQNLVTFYWDSGLLNQVPRWNFILVV